jgi:hypothetical protein
MATISNITTGEQSVTGTGAVTGTLNTSSLSGDYTIKMRIRSIVGTGPKVTIEDTANSSAFSDAETVAVMDLSNAVGPDGITLSWKKHDIPNTRFGSTNNKLRANCIIAPGTSCYVYAWLEQ